MVDSHGLRSDFMRSRLGDTTALGVASVTSGLLAYVFFAMSTRSLGAAAAAPVSVLWTYWSFAAAALTFPLQHWVARSVAAHEGEGAVHRAMARVTVLVVLTAAATGLIAWFMRQTLFHSSSVWFPVLVACVTLGAGFIGVVRGGLAARRRFFSLATCLIAENGSRCVYAAVLIAVDGQSSVAFGWCLAAGSLVGFLWPSAFRFARSENASLGESPVRFIGGAASGQLIGQAVLTGGPVLLAVSGGTAAQVTTLFAALALFRAPYTVAIGVVAKLTGYLTVLYVNQRLRLLRNWRLGVIGSGVLALPVAGGIGALVGPWLLPLIFGGEVKLSASLCALVAVGSAIALVNLVTTIMIMAQGRSGAVLTAWLIGALGGFVYWVASSLSPLNQTCWTFVVAESVAFVALLVGESIGGVRVPAEREPSSEDDVVPPA